MGRSIYLACWMGVGLVLNVGLMKKSPRIYSGHATLVLSALWRVPLAQPIARKRGSSRQHAGRWRGRVGGARGPRPGCGAGQEARAGVGWRVRWREHPETCLLRAVSHLQFGKTLSAGNLSECLTGNSECIPKAVSGDGRRQPVLGEERAVQEKRGQAGVDKN